jgi:hypothetical protein
LPQPGGARPGKFHAEGEGTGNGVFVAEDVALASVVVLVSTVVSLTVDETVTVLKPEGVVEGSEVVSGLTSKDDESEEGSGGAGSEKRVLAVWGTGRMVIGP